MFGRNESNYWRNTPEKKFTAAQKLLRASALFNSLIVSTAGSVSICSFIFKLASKEHGEDEYHEENVFGLSTYYGMSIMLNIGQMIICWLFFLTTIKISTFESSKAES